MPGNSPKTANNFLKKKCTAWQSQHARLNVTAGPSTDSSPGAPAGLMTSSRTNGRVPTSGAMGEVMHPELDYDEGGGREGGELRGLDRVSCLLFRGPMGSGLMLSGLRHPDTWLGFGERAAKPQPSPTQEPHPKTDEAICVDGVAGRQRYLHL